MRRRRRQRLRERWRKDDGEEGVERDQRKGKREKRENGSERARWRMKGTGLGTENGRKEKREGNK